MFVDACAMVAILTEESEAEAYSHAIDDAPAPWTSAIAVFEAVLVMARPGKSGLDVANAHEALLDFLGARGVALRELGRPEEVLRHAVQVAVRHGVSRKKLSSFDCFHYASAKAAGAPLLTLDRLLRDTDVPTLP